MVDDFGWAWRKVSEERDGSFRSKPVKRAVAGGNSELEIILFGSSWVHFNYQGYSHVFTFSMIFANFP